MQTSSTVAITGNTYPVKEALKALGARWDADQKAWMVPVEKAAQAKLIVSGASSASHSDVHRPRKCRICGHVERRDSRGYLQGDPIYKSGECQSCYEERKMGY
jgi:hypothetical protein